MKTKIGNENNMGAPSGDPAEDSDVLEMLKRLSKATFQGPSLFSLKNGSTFRAFVRHVYKTDGRWYAVLTKVKELSRGRTSETLKTVKIGSILFVDGTVYKGEGNWQPGFSYMYE